jgi:hypothetical protein
MSLLIAAESSGEDPYGRNVSYQERWRAHLRKHRTGAATGGGFDDVAGGGGIVTVYDCVHLVGEAPDGGLSRSSGGSSSSSSTAWVLACTSHGCVYAWVLAAASFSSAPSDSSRRQEDAGVGDDEWAGIVEGEVEADAGKNWEPNASSSLLRARHEWQLNPHRTALYRLRVAGTSSSGGGGAFFDGRILLVAGEDCGILAYDLGRLVLQQQEQVTPLRRFEPYPNPFATVPVTDLFVREGSNKTATLTAVAPDDWGLYRWRLETGDRVPLKIPGRAAADGAVTCACPLLRGGQQPRGDREDKSSLLVGSESGVVYCLIDDDTTAAGPEGASRIDMRALLRLPEATVTHLAEINCWWTVAGAQGAGTQQPGGGGYYVATVHGPSRSVVHWVSPRETPQRLLCSPARHRVVVLSNTPVVQHLEAVSLDAKERCWSSLKSCHAVTAIETGDGDAIVVGGVGRQLDVYRASTRILALGM